MLKSKKLFILLVVVAVVMSLMTVTVKASSGNILNLDDLLQNGTNTTQNPDDSNSNVVANEVDEPANTQTNTSGGGQVVQPNTNSDNSEAANNLPQTGVTEDITVMFFIVVCVILAIYAYKKVRDYKA